MLLATPFLTLDVDADGERGLLGVAFDPDFASNHYVYVYYTAKTPITHNRVSRFTADGNIAVAGSEVVILELDDAVVGDESQRRCHPFWQRRPALRRRR